MTEPYSASVAVSQELTRSLPVNRNWVPQTLCRLSDLADGQTRGFTASAGGEAVDIFVQRRGAAVVAYVNSCPHTGAPLDWLPDRFLALDGRHFLCATHGALFRPEDGYCVAGPCAGDRLEAVPVVLSGDAVRIAGEPAVGGPSRRKP